jgi:hypothetical protein
MEGGAARGGAMEGRGGVLSVRACVRASLVREGERERKEKERRKKEREKKKKKKKKKKRKKI